MDETSIFKRILPAGVKYIVYLAGLTIIASGLLYASYPSLEKNYKRSSAETQMKTFVSFLENYPTELEKGRACYTKAKEEYYEEYKPYCEAQYREAKLNYDSCREYGSRTFCLAYDHNDYESIDCSKETLTKEMPYSRVTCSLTTVDVESNMDSYFLYYKNLDIVDRIEVLRKMLDVMEKAPDSNFTTVLVEKLEANYFKEESEEMKRVSNNK